MFFFASMLVNMQGVMLTNYIVHYGLESSQQGAMSMAQSIGSLLALVIVVLAAGRISKPAQIAAAVGSYAVLAFTVGSLPPFLLIVSVFVVLGIMFGVHDTLGSAVIADIHNADANPYRWMGLLHASYALGGLTAPMATQGLIALGFAWNDVFRLLGAVFIALFAIYLYILYKGRAEGFSGSGSADMAAQTITLPDILAYLKDRRNLVLLFSVFFFAGHQNIVSLWLSRYVSEYMNAPALGAFVLSAFWLGIMLCRLSLTGRKVNAVRFLVVGCVLTAVFLAVGVFVGNPYVMLVIAVLVGLTDGAMLPLSVSLNCLWNHQNTTLANNIMCVFIYCAMSLAAPLVAWIVANIAPSAGMLSSSVLALLGGALIFTLRHEPTEGV